MLAAEKEKWQAAEERIRQLEMTNNLLAEYLNTQAQTIYLNEQNAARQNEIHAEEKQNMFAAVQALLAVGFRVIAVDTAFREPTLRDDYRRQHPSVVTMGEPESSHLLVAQVIDAHGLPEVVVSNDSHPARHVPIEVAPLSELHASLDRLLVRPFQLAQALTPHLKQRGSGKLIFITSCRTALPQLGGAIPDMARAGANALVRSLSIELAPFGIPVNAIAPR